MMDNLANMGLIIIVSLFTLSVRIREKSKDTVKITAEIK